MQDNIYQKPLVSIIMATYNRSNIIGFSIKSVLNQNYTNWELIIVGDACSDDTHEVIEEFKDPRISFVNLSVNNGEQSIPNNYGLKLAKGKFIAFINHDDLWFDAHLDISINTLLTKKVDLVYGHSAIYLPNLAGFSLGNASRSGTYDGYRAIPASTWVFDKKLLEEIGYWRKYDEIFNIPSQDWLLRVFHAKKKIVSTLQVTSILIQSGTRKDSYRNREFLEHQEIFKKLYLPNFKEIILHDIAVNFNNEFIDDLPTGLLLKLAIKNILKKMVLKMGFSPSIIRYLWKKKGYAIRKLRKIRGLETITNKTK